MPADDGLENISLDASPLEQFKGSIASQHARTRNLVTLILVWAVVLSLPTNLVVYVVLGISKCPEAQAKVEPIFDRWFSLIGPLAGAAVGAYYVSTRKT